MAKNAADMVFKNGLVVTPSRVIEGGVAVVNGKIGAVGSEDFLPDAEREIDLAGRYLMPGVIDPECHLGSHRVLAEDFRTETRAAAAAGVTTWGMQLVSLAITGGADKVKGPADIPSFTQAMPLYYEAAHTAAIDCIGSDHVAHTRTRASMETGNVWTTISGFPSRVEGMLPMMLSEGVNKGRISIERLAQVASENPARIFGLYPKKGAILPGADADLIVVDLKRRATVTKELLHTITPWSIYEGWEVTGRPVMTVVRGNIVMEWPEGAPRAKVSSDSPGKYLRRSIGQ